MILNIKDRFRNKFFWISIAALIPLISYSFGLNMDFIPDNYREIVIAFLNLLVVGGVINNPTTENSWLSDDKK